MNDVYGLLEENSEYEDWEVTDTVKLRVFKTTRTVEDARLIASDEQMWYLSLGVKNGRVVVTDCSRWGAG